MKSIFSGEYSSQYLARVRKNSCYSTARKIIGVMFWLSIAAVLLASGLMTFATSSFEFDGFSALIGGLSPLVSLIVSLLGLILARAAAFAFFDIADILIEAHRSKNEDA
jgi:hypothetical protein